MAHAQEKETLAESGTPITIRSRFISSLVPPFILLSVCFVIIMYIVNRLEGGFGLFLGIAAGGSFGFGVLLAYWNAVDWANLKIIRKHVLDSTSTMINGELVAFSGTTIVDGDPLTSPFTEQPCAAYTYTIAITIIITRQRSRHRGSTRRVLAQGFHMLPTRIQNKNESLSLGALPSVEDDLRVDEQGKWTTLAREKLEQLIGSAPRGSEREREEALLDAKYKVAGEIHQDFCQLTELGSENVFMISEEMVPVNEEICVVGTYDEEANAILAGNPRFGPDVMVYKGGAEEVVNRIDKDIRWYLKFIAGFVGFTFAVLGYAFFV